MSTDHHRVERDLEHIADHATPSPTAWEAFQSRIAEQTNQPQTEIIMLDKNHQPPRRVSTRTWVIGAAAALVVVVAGVVAVARPDDGTNVVLDPAETSTITEPDVRDEIEPVPTVANTATSAEGPSAAEQVALDFIADRAAWDGEAVRALVADDAAIAAAFEWADAPDDYLLLDDFERASGVRFLDPDCDEGSPGRVRCTYTMESNLTTAIGVGPYSNSFLFEISDGKIHQVNHNRTDNSGVPGAFFTDVYTLVFRPWLEANHPGDADLMFNPIGDNNLHPPLITVESVALWAERVPEFIASLDATG